MTPEEFFAVLRDMPVPAQPSFRLYHDDQGRPMFYTMEDVAGNWIEVDAVTYAQARMDICVVAGKIVNIPRTPTVTKLIPGDQGVCCDPRDICLITQPHSPHIKWSLNSCD